MFQATRVLVVTFFWMDWYTFHDTRCCISQFVNGFVCRDGLIGRMLVIPVLVWAKLEWPWLKAVISAPFCFHLLLVLPVLVSHEDNCWCSRFFAYLIRSVFLTVHRGYSASTCAACVCSFNGVCLRVFTFFCLVLGDAPRLFFDASTFGAEAS